MEPTTSGGTTAAQHAVSDKREAHDRSRRWPGLPAALAYLAGIVFTLAASATNLSYGLTKGTTAIEQAIYGAVAVACSVVFAVGMPAFAKAVASRSVAPASMVACALMVCGSYSIVGALGAAAGARTHHAAIERQAASDRERLTSAHERARVELARMAGQTPSAALADRIAALKSTPGANACAKVDGPVSRGVCAKVEMLEAEGRALDREHRDRRTALEGEMRSASEALTNMKAVRPANSDALALVEFLGALGIGVTLDVVNRLLVLLQVMLLEMGGGLSLTVGAVLAGGPGERRVRGSATVGQPSTGGSKTPTAFASSEPAAFSTQASEHTGEPPIVADPAAGPKTRASGTAHVGEQHGEQSEPSTARGRLLGFVQGQGGRVHATQRALAEAVGVSVARVNTLIGELRTEGKLQVRAGSTGTVLSIA